MRKTPKDLNDLGDKAFYGINQEKNIELAYTYYKEAADMNNPVGLYNLGLYYYVKEDYKKAFKLFKKATDLSYSPAYMKLFDMYFYGNGVHKSYKKAFKYVKAAADTHDVEVYHKLARMYEEGIGVKSNLEKAFEYYNLSASNNQVNGMYGLALLYFKQKNKDKEHETAYYWLDKAAHMHHIPSIKKMIEIYEQPHEYLSKKSSLYLDEMKFHYQEILAKTKDLDALILVAKAYEEGRTYLQVNYQKAFEYYRILHELEAVEGYLGLGKAYLYGIGTSKDYDRAKDYLEIASSRNNGQAKSLLGDIYRNGWGVKADYQLAKEHYIGAAEDNQVDALVHLSLMHYRKQINHANPLQAFTYIERACKQESPKAYFWLGLYYELGIGVDQDFNQSIEAYKKAIQLGNNASRYKLAYMLYRNLKKQSISKRKTDQLFEEIKILLITYIETVDSDNRLKAMYLLADIFKDPSYSKSSAKISRYYYELAAENGYSKAMNRLYEIYIEEDIQTALAWLQKACDSGLDGEAYYKMSLIYEQGLHGMTKDHVKAEKYLAMSAKLNNKLALEKITFEGESNGYSNA